MLNEIARLGQLFFSSHMESGLEFMMRVCEKEGWGEGEGDRQTDTHTERQKESQTSKKKGTMRRQEGLTEVSNPMGQKMNTAACGQGQQKMGSSMKL